jgi:hypothetical protein
MQCADLETVDIFFADNSFIFQQIFNLQEDYYV